jgi:hypothetical protein
MAYGVGTDPVSKNADVLMVQDLLNGGNPVTITDNVVNLQAVYGISSTTLPPSPITGRSYYFFPPNVVQWVPATGNWDAATLMNGSAASADRIKQIRAVRIAIVARSAQLEKDDVSPASLTLFSDLAGATVTIGLSASERKYRYKVFETTIALRNTQFSAGIDLPLP